TQPLHQVEPLASGLLLDHLTEQCAEQVDVLAERLRYACAFGGRVQAANLRHSVSSRVLEGGLRVCQRIGVCMQRASAEWRTARRRSILFTCRRYREGSCGRRCCWSLYPA